MGCKARGQPGQPFSHKTGHGYVKAHRGFYHDAICNPAVPGDEPGQCTRERSHTLCRLIYLSSFLKPN